MKIALVHDYLIYYGGAERVLKTLHQMLPHSPIYLLFYDPEIAKNYFSRADLRPSFLQKLPNFFKKKYHCLLPLLPLAVESFNLRDFDLVISSSSAFAKGIITRFSTLHICYCHTPMRFLWDQYHNKIKNENLIKKSFLAKAFLHYTRMWDQGSSHRVDYFLANSRTTAQRIWKYYRRQAKVIYPPVFDRSKIFLSSLIEKDQKFSEDYFLIVSRLVPSKRIDLAVEAFNRLNLPLVVIGDGPQYNRLCKSSKSNIKFLGWQSDEIVSRYYAHCLALIVPGEEDFGITAVEAMSYGKPVLAYRSGGVTETVIEGITGEFFDDQTPEILADGVRRLQKNLPTYSPLLIKKRAELFSREKFIHEIKNFIEKSSSDKMKL